MSHCEPDHDQHDLESAHEISNGPLENSFREIRRHTGERHSMAVPFQLIADFVVEARTLAKLLNKPDLIPEERDLVMAVLTTPEALNRMCRLAIVSDLESDPGPNLEGVFRGPQFGDILDCLLAYLSADVRDYWTRRRAENYASFRFSIGRIFSGSGPLSPTS